MKELILKILENYYLYENCYDNDINVRLEELKGSIDNLIREYVNNALDDYGYDRIMYILEEL